MKQYFGILFIIFLFSGCISEEDSETSLIKSSFDKPFPKRTKDLTWKFGSEFSIKKGTDTIDFKVVFNRSNKNNLIINQETKDTIFIGTVCKYKGIYYFNKQINDTSYWIYAVRIEGKLIRGLNTERFQMLSWDKKYESLLTENKSTKTYNNIDIIKYVDPERDIIRLTPIKKKLKEFYESIIDSLKPDTLIDFIQPMIRTEVIQEIEEISVTKTDEFEIIEKVYPNPAKDYCTIKIREVGKHEYGIYDLNGKLIKKGFITDRINDINLTELNRGIYFFRLYPCYLENEETIKLIIEK